MNIVGIIAEYNPFHNGHAYQIRQAKEAANADYCIVVMSGNFVQRGIPAITDKFTRAKMALMNGADFVFELPSVWATSSAEDFAAAGVAFLDKLGCVTHISFGCETKDFSLLTSLADLFADEPEELSHSISSYTKDGLAFPKARESAVNDYFHRHPIADSTSSIHEILASPNNILALEYLKAIRRRHSALIPCPITRQGAGYHETDTSLAFVSATGIRNAITNPVSLQNSMPKSCYSLLFSEDSCFVYENDLSQMLFYRLYTLRSSGYSDFLDSSEFLSNRIENCFENYIDFTSFCSLLKTKEITYTRISRLLLHILLDITKEDIILGKELDYIPYFRVLGFTNRSKKLFTEMHKVSSIPLITRTAKAKEHLNEDACQIFDKDLFASGLYYGIQTQKLKITQKNEYQRQIILI